jgi:RNA polymerase sigma-70 factor (ECF subfamily)
MTASAAAADDVAQEAFERAFRRLATFDGRSAFRTWLSRIVINQAIDASRREQRLDSLPSENELPSEESDEPALGDPDLVEAVLALAPQRKAVIVLRYWIGHSPPEIADILGVPVGTVHSRLARGLADLRSQLEVADVSEH